MTLDSTAAEIKFVFLPNDYVMISLFTANVCRDLYHFLIEKLFQAYTPPGKNVAHNLVVIEQAWLSIRVYYIPDARGTGFFQAFFFPTK